jgi:lysophospholipase L1-like esterase
MDQIILFGDSITQGSFEPGLNGIGQRLAHIYARKLDVINRGLSGYNAKWAWPVFKQQFPPPGANVRLLTIWLGANDACIPPSPQCNPLPDFIQDMKRIIDYAQTTSPSTRIILITAPPFDSAYRAEDLAARDPPIQLDRGFDNTFTYARAVIDLGAQKDLPVLDAFGLIWEDAGKKEENLKPYFTDGLHLSERAYKIVYDALVRKIAERYSDLDPEKMEYVFPPWKEIDWTNPGPSLVPKRN